MADPEQMDPEACPFCDGFGWLDSVNQPTGPDGDEANVCPCCNAAGMLNAYELQELRELAREHAIMLAALVEDGVLPSGECSAASRTARVLELVGQDPKREKATAADLERWYGND